jgi:hypothetical protein
MQTRRRSIPARAAVLGVALVATMAVAAAPALAADPSYEGWFLALDAAMTQTTGLDQHYATAYDPATGGQELLILDNDAGFSGQAGIGYKWGELGALTLSYWSFDNDDNTSAVENTRVIYPTVFGGYGANNSPYGGTYGLGVGYSFPVNYSVTSSVKASTIDLEYSRPVQVGERVTISWIAGLRSVTFEEDLGFSGDDSAGYYYIQDRHIKSDGYGIKVGALFGFGLTEHFNLQGLLAFSLLQGSTDAVTTQTAVGGFDDLTVSNDNIRGEIRDYDLRAMWSWKTVDAYFGYGGSTWDGLAADPTGDMNNLGATKSDGHDRSSIGFNSFHAGVVFRFGGG